MTNASDVEKIVEIAILTLDLKYTNELNNLRMEIEKIPATVDTKISACREEGYKKRRWNFTAIFTVIMAVIAAGSAIAANL